MCVGTMTVILILWMELVDKLLSCVHLDWRSLKCRESHLKDVCVLAEQHNYSTLLFISVLSDKIYMNQIPFEKMCQKYI